MISKASLRLKLTLGFGVLIVALGANSLVGLWSVARLKNSRETLRLADEKRKLSLVMQSALEQQRAGVRGLLLGNTSLDEFEDGRGKFQDASGKLPPLLKTAEGRQIFTEMMQASDSYGRLLDRELELRKSGKTKAAIALSLSSEAVAVRRSVNTAIDNMLRRQEDNRNAALDQERSAQTETEILLAVFAALGLLSGIAISFFVPRSLARNISAMTSVIREIASNNLAVDDLLVTSQDELGRTCAALNGMKNSLRDLIQPIARTAEHVASASEEISSSANQQAQGAETQKGQATQVAVAMQEMSATVHEVSENSNLAAQASQQAADTAREGGAIVEGALAKVRLIAESVSATAQKMEELGKSSDQIGRIIGVIDDIADQTNLLALNAAIEAARAGEQGRGFAVVADEVRKLAERTTAATKEVAQMVQSIQSGTKSAVAAMHLGTTQVEDGVQTTARAGDSLKQIIRMSEQVGEMITHIATAATEQSSATDQVNQNVEQITRLVGESAIGAQQSAKACQDLSGIALDLQKSVASFSVKRDCGSADVNNGIDPSGALPRDHPTSTSERSFAASGD
jgi:methyl-accepting chemotaxis protein